MKNVYENFKGLQYDRVAETYGHVIIRSYQVIPKYWLCSNPENRLIIMNWTTGSGKTIGGLMTVIRQIRAIRMNELNSLFTNMTIDLPKVLVIGEWMTQSQIENELCRREFTLMSDTEWMRIDRLKNSNKSKDRASGKEMQKKYIRKLKRYIQFMGYQSLVLSLLPYYAKFGLQDITNMISDYKHDKLRINKEFLERIRNTVIIVDEMQRLYSASGLNTYGFALAYLVKHATELNLKFAFMTGTLLNSSIVELTEVMNLCAIDHLEYFDREEFFENIGESGSFGIWRFKRAQESVVLNSIRPHFMYYSKSSKKTVYARVNSAAGVNASVILQSQDVDIDAYPVEYLIGTLEISDSFTVYGLEARGEQLKQMASREFEDPSDDPEGNSRKLSIYDAGLPLKEKWSANGISLGRDGIYTGSFLERKNIGKYSVIAEFIIDSCIENSMNNEKTVLYHSRIRNFGLLQYARILEINGFVRYGQVPNQRSICRNCGKTFEKHSDASKSCPSFQAIFFSCLYGEMNAVDRQKIVNEVYNSPLNLYGGLISVLLISDVAYVGVSLLSTNNMYILSPVSNISKLNQIQARVNRFKSHAALPVEKRFVRQYILGVCTDGVRSILKNRILEYYKTRFEASIEIDKSLVEMKRESLGEILMEYPEKLKLTDDETRNTMRMLYEDTLDCMKTITSKIQLNSKSNMWREELLIERICDPKFALSFIDLRGVPKDFIINSLKRSPFIEMFKVEGQKSTLVKNRTITDKSILPHYPSMDFEEVEVDHYKLIDDLKKLVARQSDPFKLFSYYKRAINILLGIDDLSPTVGWNDFWEFMFIIGNEYYENDETDYLINHGSKNRSIEKMKGAFIGGNRILLTDGKVKFIKFSFVIPSPYKSTGSVFKIENKNGFNQLFAYEYGELMETDETVDRRCRGRGQACSASSSSDVFKELGLNSTLRRRYINCVEIQTKLCDEQAKFEGGIFLLTPFQR